MNLFSNASSVGDADAQGRQLTAPEAERWIEQLCVLGLRDVGSQRWHQQLNWISQLNVQAHTNAATHSEEFVVELLVSLDKMKVLVHHLLLIEAWKLHVMPHLRKHLLDKVELSMIYMLLYQECTVANLLEVTLFHSHAMEAVPEEYLLELADWSYRKLTFLNSPDGRAAAAVGSEDRSAKELMALGKEQDLAEKEAEVDFGAGMLGLTILRYMTDSVTKLPMGLLGRLVSTNDCLMALVPLLDNPPWVRRRGKGKAMRTEKWVNNVWQVVDPSERLRITQADGQAWLTVNNLLVEPRCRAKYAPDEWRRDRLLSLKRYMNELLFDQLPVLRDLQRVLDEMALGAAAPQDPGAARSAALILETVPVVLEAILREAGDPRLLALDQARGVFSEAETRKAAQAQLEAMMQQLDMMVGLAGDPLASAGAHGVAAEAAAGQAAAADIPGPVRVSCWRKAHKHEVYESWCDFEMLVDSSRPAEPVSLEELQGIRYRLLAPDAATARSLPTEGKVCVKLGGALPLTGAGPLGPATPTLAPTPLLIAEALLQLPEIAVKSAAGEQPPVVWVNIGLLAEDGMVLQLKLKRAGKLVEKDTVAGGWYAYQPAGGALTLLKGVLEGGGGGVLSQPASKAGAAAASKPKGPMVLSATDVRSPVHTAAALAGKPGMAPQASAPTSSQQQQQQPPPRPVAGAVARQPDIVTRLPEPRAGSQEPLLTAVSTTAVSEPAAQAQPQQPPAAPLPSTSSASGPDTTATAGSVHGVDVAGDAGSLGQAAGQLVAPGGMLGSLHAGHTAAEAHTPGPAAESIPAFDDADLDLPD